MYLTPREKEVLGLLLSGHTNKEIAELLRISAFTVRDHVSRLLRKGRARNRTELLSSPLSPQWLDRLAMKDRPPVHEFVYQCSTKGLTGCR